MGSCFGRCCPFQQLLRRRLSNRTTKFDDQTNLVEFECLMETSPSHEEPISISSMLSFKRKKRSARQEEELELEEEAFMEARREASRVARFANGQQQQQIINPARLVFRDRSTSWHDDEPNINGNGFEDDLDEFIDENKLRTLTTSRTTYLPSHSSFLDSADSSTLSSFNGKVEDFWTVSKNGFGGFGSTPPSSLDLEWDEAGVFVNGGGGGRGSAAAVASESNKNSTPASNDLEWDDNDFENNSTSSSSPHHHHNSHLNDNLDAETEQLISEIEKLTSNALQETMRNDYR